MFMHMKALKYKPRHDDPNEVIKGRCFNWLIGYL